MTDQLPKKTGMLVVGLGGNNGVTLLAGHVANQRGLSWESAAVGRVSAPVWHGCITQLTPRGAHGGVGLQGEFPLASALQSVVAGWDIRPTPLGDALYASRILDYDLVRQVRDELNQIPIWKGVYHPGFVGESQYATATHVVPADQGATYLELVNHLRRDIRTFIDTNEIDGHTTVIWSASVERPADVEFATAEELLHVIVTGDSSQQDVSPSILYAVAAALEGCSFVNGGSQNTMSPGLYELFEMSFRSVSSTCTKTSNSSWWAAVTPVATTPAYILGTDFKAGQTKFKTAAVEYLRALGLKPRVIASSNHLGNNDMLNLTSKKTINAKLRVKSNIFGPWHEDDLDHQVKVMYTPYMLDEKRDLVEYTSLGYLHCPHTMLTYTRCMDSVLCVPLMIDAAIFCDYFARAKAPSEQVARATSYLFKIPEGGAKGVDPGFHHQMRELREGLAAARSPSTAKTSAKDLQALMDQAVAKGIISADQAAELLKL